MYANYVPGYISSGSFHFLCYFLSNWNTTPPLVLKMHYFDVLQTVNLATLLKKKDKKAIK